MATATTSDTPRRKGRWVTDKPLVHVNLKVEEFLWKWALEQPKGAATLVRRLLAEEYARQHSEQHHQKSQDA